MAKKNKPRQALFRFSKEDEMRIRAAIESSKRYFKDYGRAYPRTAKEIWEASFPDPMRGRQAAAYLKISYKALVQAAATDLLTPERKGRVFLFYKSDLNAHCEALLAIDKNLKNSDNPQST
ncbi:MAG: hypothetical protein LIP09_04835 [Bacteroidales bacterium]|nr:hypothetical protein [Bacteroidales bacterium]